MINKMNRILRTQMACAVPRAIAYHCHLRLLCGEGCFSHCYLLNSCFPAHISWPGERNLRS